MASAEQSERGRANDDHRERLDDSSQAEIADKAIAQYVEDRKKALKGRLGEVQRLLDEGGEHAVSRAYGKKVASRR